MRSLLDRLARALSSDRAKHQLFRHLIVGGSGVLFNWIAFSLMRHFTRLSTLDCTLIVHVILLATIFPLQKLFTFRVKQDARGQALRFLANDAGYIALDWFLAWSFIDWLGLPVFIGKGLGLAVLTPLSFLSQRLWVFRRPPTSAGS